MSLTPGTRLGTYEVVEAVGAGGMGEVYRARDTRLERHVALKLVLEAFVADPDRAMRFEREAITLAALNHPNIATLYGLEQAGGRHFLVMEFVDGVTLAERIAAQPAGVRVEDALAIACQIAEALEAAHEKGIIHRDLKPANVKITSDDKVKVLDFGLAKALGTDEASHPGATLMNSPTFTSPAMTNMGVILGTASYMSPEQARGYAADHRSDIFSFGVVLYEMLTGRQPFPGETISDVLASVLARDPDLAALPRDLSPRLIELVKRCLEKNPKRRWQAIGDVRFELETIQGSPRALPVASVAAAASQSPRYMALRYAATALAAAILVGVPAWYRTVPAPPANVVRFGIHLPDEQVILAVGRPAIAISPDATHVAYVANRQLYVRAVGDLQPAMLVPNEKRAPINSLVFSPDGRTIAFWNGSGIARVSLSGGPQTSLARVDRVLGMTWTGDALFYGGAGGVYRLPAMGGTAERLVEVAADEHAIRPQLLRDGQTVLFTLLKGQPDDAQSSMVAQRIGSATRTTLVENAVDGRYVNGYLVFAREGVLFATSWDGETLEAPTAATPIVEGVRRGLGVTGVGTAQYSISSDGSLAYLPGPKEFSVFSELSLAMIDQSGQVQRLKVPPGPYTEVVMSHDGRKIAFVRNEMQRSSIWIYEPPAGGAARRLTFGDRDRFPVWSRDGAWITFQSSRDGKAALYRQRADGSGVPERLTDPETGVSHVPNAWAPDGRLLLFDEIRGNAVMLMVWDTGTKAAREFGEVRSMAMTAATFSPDGRWVAYNSRTSTTDYNLVRVQPYPATGALYEISKTSEDGHHAVWSNDGRAIFYTPGPGQFMTKVPITTAPAFALGEPVTLPRPFSNQPTTTYRPFDMSPDNRFVSTVNQEQVETTNAHGDIVIVLNWFQELKAKLSAVH